MKKKFKKLSLSTETLKSLSEPSLRDAAGADSEATRICTFCTAICTVCVCY